MARNNYEQIRILEKIREFRTLFIFIILAAAAALILMNLIIFPVALAASRTPAFFSSCVGYGIFAAVILYIAVRIISRVKEYRSCGISPWDMFRASLKRKSKSLLYGIIIFLSAAALAVILYFVLSYNYYLLYEILN